jgi:hypothetical protein
LQAGVSKPQVGIFAPRAPSAKPLVALGVASVLVYFFFFAGPGLRADFSPDDLMNLYGSRRFPLAQHARDVILFFRPSPTFRPLGAMFYSVFFGWFDFNPLPYRIACFVLLLANLWLAFAVARRLTVTLSAAVLAMLLFAYHGHFWPLYISTGFCYDLLCFFFYFLALLYYLRIRASGAPASGGQVAVWCGLYILCLNSKEMAVSLPVVIASIEVLLGSPPSRLRDLLPWVARNGRIAASGAVLTMLFIGGRVTGAQSLTHIEAYRPVFSLWVYLDRARQLVEQAFYEPDWLGPRAALLALLILITGAFCSRRLALCLIWMLTGILPIAFIEPRGFSAAYIPLFALALYIAIGLAGAIGHAAGVLRIERTPRAVSAAALLAALCMLSAVQNQYGRIDFEARSADARHIRHIYEQFEFVQPKIPEKARILMLDDPFPTEIWNSTFLVTLATQDPVPRVSRADWLLENARPDDSLQFDAVLSYRDGRFILCSAEPFREVKVRELRGLGCQGR